MYAKSFTLLPNVSLSLKYLNTKYYLMGCSKTRVTTCNL